MKNKQSCCENPKNSSRNGFSKGLLYGILPHSFCLTFIVLSSLGATVFSGFLAKLLILPHFLEILITLSFLSATISALIYLKKNRLLSFPGIRKKWRYLTILLTTTLVVNLATFYLLMPALAGISLKKQNGTGLAKSNLSSFKLKVNLPCSGHAPLVTEELKKLAGVININFKSPDLFEITYDSQKISAEKLLSLKVIADYKGEIVN